MDKSVKMMRAALCASPHHFYTNLPFLRAEGIMKQIMKSKSNSTILPPTYLLVGMLMMLGLHYLFPITQWVPKPWILLGFVPLGFGIGLNIIADRMFSQARTTVNSLGEPSVMISEGVFSMSRNPMYLGMALVLLGVAVLLGSLSPLLIIPIFVWLITIKFIKFEENMLAEKFGARWLEYARRVRRWI